jgi:hypothetical protein
MNLGDDLNGDPTLTELLSLGADQTSNLTYYKLVFNALDQLARENSGDDVVYRRSLLRLVAGFLAGLRPEFLPQAVAAKNLLLKKARF